MSEFDDQSPFYAKRTEEERAEDKRRVFTVSLNFEEQAMLIEDMRVLRQVKDGTAIKQLWKIGRSVLHASETGEVLKVVLENTRKNERVGIVNVEPELPRLPTQISESKSERGSK